MPRGDRGLLATPVHIARAPTLPGCGGANGGAGGAGATGGNAANGVTTVKGAGGTMGPGATKRGGDRGGKNLQMMVLTVGTCIHNFSPYKLQLILHFVAVR